MSRTSIAIQVTVSPGTSIHQACKEAVELANKLGCRVEFVFNDIKTSARPGIDHEALSKKWWDEMQSKKPFKYATV